MTGVGHNQPPAHEAMALHVEDLFALVSDTTQGATVTTDEQESALDDLLDQFRRAAKDAEARRKAEKEPHLEAGRAVDAAWKPVTDRCKAATDHIKALLTPYREAKQRAKDEAAKKAREEAEAREAEARKALQQSDDLEAKFAAEQELEAAKKLTAVANKIDRSATGLRTYWEAEITDRKAALLHYLGRSPDRFEALIQQMADEDARGARAPVPGIVFHERKKAA